MYQTFKFGSGRTVNCRDYPETCPECHHKILPRFLTHTCIDGCTKFYAFLQCPSANCGICYSVIYTSSLGGYTDFWYDKIVKGSVTSEKFSNEISEISPSFVQIYNQAFHAEQIPLPEIAGVGFRKALEFLIKDYLISLYPEKKDNIKSKFLGQCIADDIKNEKIKTISQRASWLGNDETHYVRMWVDKDLQDLKNLIKLNVSWIEMEVITNRLEKDMPDPKKNKT